MGAVAAKTAKNVPPMPAPSATAKPAQPMPWRDAALHLALDIVGVNGPPDVLDRRVAQDAHDAELEVDLDVADMRAEAALGAVVLSCTPAPIGPPVSLACAAIWASVSGRELAGIGAGRNRLAIAPSPRRPDRSSRSSPRAGEDL